MVTKWLDIDTINGLKLLDTWLSKQPWETHKLGIPIDVVINIRTMITKIEEKGFYTKQEQEILNWTREQYLISKKRK